MEYIKVIYKYMCLIIFLKLRKIYKRKEYRLRCLWLFDFSCEEVSSFDILVKSAMRHALLICWLLDFLSLFPSFLSKKRDWICFIWLFELDFQSLKLASWCIFFKRISFAFDIFKSKHFHFFSLKYHNYLVSNVVPQIRDSTWLE